MSICSIQIINECRRGYHTPCGLVDLLGNVEVEQEFGGKLWVCKQINVQVAHNYRVGVL
jgi:hypothetical protein